MSTLPLYRVCFRGPRPFGARAARWAVVLAFGLGGLAPAAEVRAADPTEEQRREAKQRYDRAKELAEEGNYQAALIEFRRAYEQAPNFVVLFPIAQVETQLGDYVAAIGSYERYLLEGGDKVAADRRKTVEAELSRLAGRTATLRVVAPAGATIMVGEQSVGTAPLASGLRVNAGKVRVAVTLGGRQRTETVELAGGDSRDVVVELPPEPPRPVAPAPLPPLPPAPPPPRGVGGAVIATWSITGALTLGWGGLALAAVAASNDLASKRRVLGTTTTDLESAASNARGLALGADVVLGVTGASAVVATVVTALDRRSAATAQGGVRVGYVGPTPSGWMVAGTF